VYDTVRFNELPGRLGLVSLLVAVEQASISRVCFAKPIRKEVLERIFMLTVSTEVFHATIVAGWSFSPKQYFYAVSTKIELSSLRTAQSTQSCRL
jgi:hypothetical protein